jgi:hypothetical protein
MNSESKTSLSFINQTSAMLFAEAFKLSKIPHQPPLHFFSILWYLCPWRRFWGWGKGEPVKQRATCQQRETVFIFWSTAAFLSGHNLFACPERERESLRKIFLIIVDYILPGCKGARDGRRSNWWCKKCVVIRVMLDDCPRVFDSEENRGRRKIAEEVQWLQRKCARQWLGPGVSIHVRLWLSPSLCCASRCYFTQRMPLVRC